MARAASDKSDAMLMSSGLRTCRCDLPTAAAFSAKIRRGRNGIVLARRSCEPDRASQTEVTNIECATLTTTEPNRGDRHESEVQAQGRHRRHELTLIMSSTLPNVTIVRGLEARVPDGAFVWAVEPAVAPPWRALRSMLAQAREVVGHEPTLRAMRPHAGLLSLCLRGLDAELTRGARRVRDDAGGLRVATLPGVVSRPRALTRAFAETLVSLLSGRCHVIAIPDARRLDL